MAQLLDLSDLTAHGFCLAWRPGLLWLHAGSDIAIALAYYSIPLALVTLMRRRRDLAYPWMFALFAGFIVACGSTHVMAVVTLWRPLYWLDGWLKLITALISVVTACLLWPLLPHVLALPAPGQLRAANQRLVWSEARHRALYQRTPAALHTLDLEGRFLAVNGEWTTLFGYGEAEILGQPVTRLLEPDAAREFPALWRKLLREGTMREAERCFVCGDGTRRIVLVSATVEHDAHGAPLEVLAVVADITERRAVEAALRASEERLRQAQKMQAVGQLTGGIAHDFNNMLTVVMANLELLQDRLLDDERALRLSRTAMSGAERAARLTSQLLSFSRQQRLQPRPLHPAEVVRGIRELLERTLGDQCRLLLDRLDEATWPCLADANQLESALLNLALNAGAAMPDGGELRIEASDRRITAAELAVTETPGDEEAPEPGDYVVLSVIDTGQGMTEAVRRRATEPFFTTRPQGQGAGLGLSQIYGFLRQSGGSLRIDSTPGQGTRIAMLLPRAPAATATALTGAHAGRA